MPEASVGSHLKVKGQNILIIVCILKGSALDAFGNFEQVLSSEILSLYSKISHKVSLKQWAVVGMCLHYHSEMTNKGNFKNTMPTFPASGVSGFHSFGRLQMFIID